MTFNQFGGSLGGPIKRDRIFIFGVYEAYRERAFTLIQETLMTARLRDEALRANPSYKIYLDFIPLPNQPVSPTADTGLYINPTTSRRDDNHADVKSDIRLGNSSYVTLSYTRGRPFQLQPRHYINGANDRTFQIWDERGTATYVTGGANWTLESRYGYHLTDMNREDAFFFQQLDPNNSKEVLPFGRRVPRLSYPGVANPDQELYGMEGRTYNFDQKYARHAGKRSWKFGFTSPARLLPAQQPRSAEHRLCQPRRLPCKHHYVGWTDLREWGLYSEDVPSGRFRADRLARAQRLHVESGSTLRLLLAFSPGGERKGPANWHLQPATGCLTRTSKSVRFARLITRMSPTHGSILVRESALPITSVAEARP